MTERSRRGGTGQSGQIWLAILVVLAIAATVIMLFTKSSMWLQFALLAALWAAVLGIMLATKLRHDRDRVLDELELQQIAYEAELDAERARGEADHAALELARNNQGLPPSVDPEILREIREELFALRARLEELSGQQFAEEPKALQAEARRLGELEYKVPEATYTRYQPEPEAQPEAEEPKPVPQQTVPTAGADDDTSKIAMVRDDAEEEALSALVTGPRKRTNMWETVAGADDELPDQPAEPQPSQEESEVFGNRYRRPQGAPSSDAVVGKVGSHRAPEGRNPLSDLIRERQAELDRENELREEREKREEAERKERFRREEDERRQRAEREQQQLRERAERERREREEAANAWATEPAQPEEPAQPAQPETAGRGRRRADERGGQGLSVAELLARNESSSGK